MFCISTKNEQSNKKHYSTPAILPTPFYNFLYPTTRDANKIHSPPLLKWGSPMLLNILNASLELWNWPCQSNSCRYILPCAIVNHMQYKSVMQVSAQQCWVNFETAANVGNLSLIFWRNDLLKKLLRLYILMCNIQRLILHTNNFHVITQHRLHF